ncbi:MAG: CaiB/BaiF CoA transferase family protein [Lautropia sp.]
MLPLKGYRVIDLTSIIFGPVASQVMSDYGADVIKVESPQGDSMRTNGPAKEPGMSSNFIAVNRGKRSAVIDLKTGAGRAALQALAADADVLMHTIRPQKLGAIGLDEQVLRRHNPKLIYASLVGFDGAGPYSGRPAYDDILQGMAGNVDLMFRQVGSPQYFPSIVADKTSGLVAVGAILAALVARERTGKGAHVEVPMFESMVAFNLVEHLSGRHFEPSAGGIGYTRVLNPWRRPFCTTDGHICALPITDAQWHRFFAGIGRHELVADPRFVSQTVRTENASVLYELMARCLEQRSTDEWLRFFERIDVPASRIVGLEQLLEDEHLVATGFFETVTDAVMGDVVYPGIPVRFNGLRPPARMAPRLGEHTEQVLAEVLSRSARS